MMDKEERKRFIEFMTDIDNRSLVYHAFMEMNIKHKLVIYERHFENKKWEQVARQLDCSVRMKKNYEQEALQILYDKLKDKM